MAEKMARAAEACLQRINAVLQEIQAGVNEQVVVAGVNEVGKLIVSLRSIAITSLRMGEYDWAVGRQDWYITARLGSLELAEAVKQRLAGQGTPFQHHEDHVLWVIPPQALRKEVRGINPSA